MSRKDDELWIERRIVTGLIVSDEYIRGISEIWDTDLLQSTTARTLSDWCMEYFRRYSKSPNKDIEGIYDAHRRNGLDPDTADDIASVLSDLSDEFERGKFNVEYLMDETMKYFSIRHLKRHVNLLQGELDTGSITEAEKIATGYHRISKNGKNTVDPFTKEVVSRAFEERAQPMIKFGKALGRMWDSQFCRDSFVALMGPEKRGKSQLLLEVAIRSLIENWNVAFFQAGDMSESQQVKRICTYVAKKSTEEKYCGELLIPVLDCQKNQDNTCTLKDRTCACGVVHTSEFTFEKLTLEELSTIFKDKRNANYEHCRSDGCKERIPAIWFKLRKEIDPLTENEAQKIIHSFRRRFRKRFQLVTYPNETLTISEIKALLDTWEQTEMFVPDVIVIDYADLLAPDLDTIRMDFRHQENKKWQRLRALSQSRHCLLVTATQTDTDSYKKNLLTMDNFSETKTKYAHVTAMYGLNQSDQEKKIGIMRINEIVIREGDFDRTVAVRVLQRLQIGRPYLGSF